MKRYVSSFFVFALAAPLFAEVALVYKSGNDVKKMVFSQGVVTTDGVVVSAVGLLAAGDHLLAGVQGQELKKASLVRFDNDLNLALVRIGDRASDEVLQAAHKKNSDKLTLFLPEVESVPAHAAATTLPPPSHAEKFAIKLNGIQAGTEPVILKKSREKANVLIEIVGQNIGPVWRISVDLEGEPDLAFWKKGEERGLNAIPSRRLHFDHQAFLRPYANGDTLKLAVEISTIKEENYNLKLKIDSKAGLFEKTVPVRFVDNK